MKLRYSNLGAFGLAACPPLAPGDSGACPPGALGLEYPAGSGNEHLAGAGMWVGGLLDTATTGSSSPIRLVSVTYEGWAGPYYEFYPGGTPADTIWRVDQGAPKPPGWDNYWGTDLPYRPFADDNQYCRYTDTAINVAWHVPLRLTVIHSSYVGSSADADGIHIVEYRIFNTGARVIDSVYIGFLVEPGSLGEYPNPDCFGFAQSEHLAYCWRSRDSLVSLFGFEFVHHPLPSDSIRWTFEYFPGPNTPGSDESKYRLLSSGIIRPDSWPCMIDGRFVLAAGPFSLPPTGDGVAPPLRIAIAFLGAPDLAGLSLRAQRARELYEMGTSFPLMESAPPRIVFFEAELPQPVQPDHGDHVYHSTPR
jgi:hypothetical protein